MVLYAFDDTSSFIVQDPDSTEDSYLIDSGAEIYDQDETLTSSDTEEEQGSAAAAEDPVTETYSTSDSVIDYTQQLEALEADTRVILYVLLLFLVIVFLVLTYKFYNFFMR